MTKAKKIPLWVKQSVLGSVLIAAIAAIKKFRSGSRDEK